MKTVNKSVLIWYSPREMYDLVTDVKRYSEFLPWCEGTRIVEEHEGGMTAEVAMSFGGVRQTFTTRNVHMTDSQVDMELLDGPFSHLDGQWSFLALGDGSQRACKVELAINYRLNSSTLGKLAAPAIEKIATDLVGAFVKRAEQVYGD